MVKRSHEFRDPLYGFIVLNRQERALVDTEPFQRLRHIQQLALTPLIYPGATHKRFEHSLGVMQMAKMIFDVVTDPANIHPAVEHIIPDREALTYWRVVLALAALAHDTGHLPFSHAAEKKLLPKGDDHESITLKVIEDERLSDVWGAGHPVRLRDVQKLAVGQKKLKDETFTTWESLLSEMIVGDAFGADRIDYLLRDSYHAGVSYGKFDHTRLVGSLRILPETSGNGGSTEPRLGVELGGLHSAEALLLARYFMYEQVYFHPVRRIYDLHLIDFMLKHYGANGYQVSVDFHLRQTDNEVTAAIRSKRQDRLSDMWGDAEAILGRGHFRQVYAFNPTDQAALRSSLEAGRVRPTVDQPLSSPAYEISKALADEFGAENVKTDLYIQSSSESLFPVLMSDGRIETSVSLSPILANFPLMTVDSIYAAPSIAQKVRGRIDTTRSEILAGSGK